MDEVASIRARHKSARPKPSNPAWCNSHYDLGRLLIAFDALELELAAEQEAPKWQAIAASYQSEHLALKARVAALEGILDGVELIAVNDRNGCPSCSAVVNAILTERRTTETGADACCDNEKRNMNGGCDNCGDPCL